MPHMLTGSGIQETERNGGPELDSRTKEGRTHEEIDELLLHDLIHQGHVQLQAGSYREGNKHKQEDERNINEQFMTDLSDQGVRTENILEPYHLYPAHDQTRQGHSNTREDEDGPGERDGRIRTHILKPTGFHLHIQEYPTRDQPYQ